MRIGYIKIASGLPSKIEQLAVLNENGVREMEGAPKMIWCDEMPDRRLLPTDYPFPELEKAISTLNPGDEIAVYGPSILGTRSILCKSLMMIGSRHAAAWWCCAGLSIPCSNHDVLFTLSCVEQADVELRKSVLRKAREHKFATGKTGGMRPKLDESQIEGARLIWRDTSLSPAEAAERMGISVRTAYRLFKARPKKHASA